MAKGIRPTQENSPLETGERENGQGLDLNRDAMKMEAPETQGTDPKRDQLHGTRKCLLTCIPATDHGMHFHLTWAPSYLYAGEPATYHYTNDVMLPFITKNAKE
jgi:hypothetical protein